MWLILEECGVVCAIFTYFIVTSVYLGFIRIGIWEDVQEGNHWTYLPHLIVFQYNCFMIFMSHFKCMTTEPGLLPKDTDVLRFSKLPKQLQVMIRQLGSCMYDLQSKIRSEYDEHL
mmetsp:Transcript_41861/g.64051  ORF Transcript_41861/g.64051 Transcript_41861/m.64051 type:complete len:116 (-) Transcript_41861:1129-1476(-)